MENVAKIFAGFRARITQVFSRSQRLRVAVFIDADNVHAPGVRYAFEKLSEQWNPVYRRGYGRGLMNRADIFRRHGILPVEVVPNTSGKNAADMALVIDAVNELHAHRVDAFCLVAGDSYFTRPACTEFHVFENPSQVRLTKVAGTKRKAKRPVIVSDTREFFEFVRNLTHGTGRATFSRINHEACKRYPSFSPRKYGTSNLKALMKLAEFEVRPITNQLGMILDYEVSLSDGKAQASPGSRDPAGFRG